jgi:molybdate transport system permease protein
VSVLHPVEVQALLLSAKVGLIATAATLPFGIALGWLLARRDFRGRTLVDTLVNLPLVLPPVVTGWALLELFGARGPLGAALSRAGIDVAFTWRAAALAAAGRAFPLVVRPAQVAIAAVDPGLEAAARTLGAGPLRAFLTVTLPLARHGVIAGALLGFARSLGEFGATITFAGSLPGATRTLPLAIWAALQTPGAEAAVVRLAVLSTLLAAGALALGEWIRRRGTGGAR